jgi:hypothetical protein
MEEVFMRIFDVPLSYNDFVVKSKAYTSDLNLIRKNYELYVFAYPLVYKKNRRFLISHLYKRTPAVQGLADVIPLFHNF